MNPVPSEHADVGRGHFLWIAAAAALGFLTSFVFADQLALPTGTYHLVYFVLVGGFVTLYATITGVTWRVVVRRRLGPALVLGVLCGLALTQRVLADPASAGPAGWPFVWDLFRRGVVYGSVDGVLLSTLPWVVTWRGLGGETASRPRQAGISLLALGLALLVTSAYHLGYPDFRGAKLGQANLGNAIATLPTLLSRNPLASPLAHVMLHLAAVAHNPQSDLFLPPHPPPASRRPRRGQTGAPRMTRSP